MKNLINFFFSFDKLFKEKLIVPAFWLAIIFVIITALVRFIDTVHLDPLNWLFGPIAGFLGFLFALLMVRIVAELAVAVFRINDNLSPDKGRSELVDIDPVAEARKAAELAAARTRELTKSATEKTRSTFDDVKHQVEDKAEAVTSKAKTATQSAKSKTESVMGKGSVPDADADPVPVKTLEPSAVDGAAVKRGRGRPKGSKNKPKAAAATTAPTKRGPGRPKGSKNKPKTDAAPASGDAPVKRRPGRPKGSKNKTTTSAAKTTSTPKKRGPKPGQKVPRDADGNLLKKDGTPRKKPGPKPKA